MAKVKFIQSIKSKWDTIPDYKKDPNTLYFILEDDYLDLSKPHHGSLYKGNILISDYIGKEEIIDLINNIKDYVDINVELITNKLDNKVDKVEGKDLSTNDFDNDCKTKLEDIEDNAQVNKIDTVAVEGNNIDVINKSVNITKTQLGLDNVDNTKDIDKPISKPTQTVLNDKVDKQAGKQLTTNDYSNSEKSKVATALQPYDIEQTYKPESENALSGKAVNSELQYLYAKGSLNKRRDACTQNALIGKPIELVLNGIEPQVYGNLDEDILVPFNTKIYVTGEDQIGADISADFYNNNSTYIKTDTEVLDSYHLNINNFPIYVRDNIAFLTDQQVITTYNITGGYQTGILRSHSNIKTLSIKEGKRYRASIFIKVLTGSQKVAAPSIGIFKDTQYRSNLCVNDGPSYANVYDNNNNKIYAKHQDFSYITKIDTGVNKNEWYKYDIDFTANYTGIVYFLIRSDTSMNLSVCSPMFINIDNETKWTNKGIDKCLLAIGDTCDTLNLTTGDYIKRIGVTELPANYTRDIFEMTGEVIPWSEAIFCCNDIKLMRHTCDQAGDFNIPSGLKKLSYPIRIYYQLRNQIQSTVDTLKPLTPTDNTRITTSCDYRYTGATGKVRASPNYDAKYYRDINAVLDDLSNAITQIGGTL